MANPEGSHDSAARIQIIIAVIGLLGVVAAALISNWNSIFPKANPAQTPTQSSPGPAPKRGEIPVRSSGRLVVRGTWQCDLDAGAEVGSGGDFRWDQENAVKRYLVPENGAVFFVVGIRDFKSVTHADLEHFPYSAQRIDASDTPGNNIPKGTLVAYRTKQGRLGKFQVTDYGYNLTIHWITDEK